MKKITTLSFLFLLLTFVLSSPSLNAQLPDKVLVGYWHNWGFLRINALDPRYNVIMLSFLEADKNFNSQDNVVGDLEFTPSQSRTTIKSDIAEVQARGKKVLISIGGANGSFKLNSEADKNTFVTKVKDFINEYRVDGIDLDLEQKVYVQMKQSEGNILVPSAPVQYLIDGVKELLTWYQSTFGRKMLLTTAPETWYVQGGLSSYAGPTGTEPGGSWLPVLEALRNDFDLVMVQLYNSGGILDLNGVERYQGTTTFIVALTEALIRGFNHAKGWGYFNGIPASKVCVALPACTGAAGGGFINSTDMIAAVKYLMGTGPKVGDYTLKKSGGYPDLAGIMTWSLDNDYRTDCGSRYSFADAADQVIGPISNENIKANTSLELVPNPSDGRVQVKRNKSESAVLSVFNQIGIEVFRQTAGASNVDLDLSSLPAGIYIVRVDGASKKLVIQ